MCENFIGKRAFICEILYSTNISVTCHYCSGKTALFKHELKEKLLACFVKFPCQELCVYQGMHAIP